MENSKILSLISKSDLKKEQKDAILANLGNLILGNSDDRIELDTIVNSDISKEGKEALLGVFADRLIKEKSIEEKTWEQDNKEIIEKAKKQTADLHKRLDDYQRRGYEQEQERKKEQEKQEYIKTVEEKEKILKELINKNGEKPYNSFESYSEIEHVYSFYEGTKELELAKKAYEEKINNSMNPEKETNTKDENNDITLNELEAGMNDEQKEDETKENDDITSEQLKAGINDGPKENEQPQKDIDLKPEGKKRPKLISQAKEFLKNKLDSKAAKAVLAIAAAGAALALLITNFPALVAVAGGAYIGNEFNKGKKL